MIQKTDKILSRALFIALLIFVVTLPLAPYIGQADAASDGLVPCGGANEPPCTMSHLFVLLHNVLDFAITRLAPLFVVIMLVFGGFNILTSAGNPGRVNKGKELIKWALVGYALILLSWIIINTIFSLIGLAEWTGLNRWWDIKL